MIQQGIPWGINFIGKPSGLNRDFLSESKNAMTEVSIIEQGFSMQPLEARNILVD